MNNLSVLEKLANPDLIGSMTVGEKLIGSLYVATLGMCITFIALMILWGLIGLMTKICAPKPVATKAPSAPSAPAQPKTIASVSSQDDAELVAVIAAAVAASLGTSASNLVVRNIVRVEDTTPVWGRTGRLDLMNKMI